MAIQEQDVLAFFFMGDGIAVLYSFSTTDFRIRSSIRMERTRETLSKCNGRIHPRIPVGCGCHPRFARCAQSIQAKRHVIGIAAMLSWLWAEIPQIDKFFIARIHIVELEFSGANITWADKGFRRYVHIFNQKIETG